MLVAVLSFVATGATFVAPIGLVMFTTIHAVSHKDGLPLSQILYWKLSKPTKFDKGV